MESESKRRRVSATVSDQRNWSGLPDLLLHSITDHLSSAVDLFAFAAVCRSWRSFLGGSSSSYLSACPPLLLVSDYNSYRCSRLFWFESFHKHYFRTLLPPQFRLVDHICLGFSHGYLILIDSLGYCMSSDDDDEDDVEYIEYQLSLCDPFTGLRIQLPSIQLPHLTPCRDDGPPYGYAALTAPPSDPNSTLLVFSKSSPSFLSLRLGRTGRSIPQRQWSTHHLDPPTAGRITSVLSFRTRGQSNNHRIFAISSEPRRLRLLEFTDSCQAIHDLNVGGISGPLPSALQPQLIECGGDLLLPLFLEGRVDVYKLDLGLRKWVPLKSIGDHALFVDFRGKSSGSCSRPERWGGRSNSVYVAGMEGAAYSLEDGRMISRSDPRWSSIAPRFKPVWVYPSFRF